MESFQTVWPGSWSYCPGPAPYELPVPRLEYSDYARVVVPCYCSRVTQNQNQNLNQKENRRFFLDRSVFDLVDAHPYLSLTDPKLLGWYLRLSPEDRKLIQDEGGFHQFLQRHPALELSSHHVYVKYNIRSAKPAKPAMTSTKKSGGKKCTCDEELNKLPSHLRETLSLLSCCNDNEPKTRPCEQLVPLQDSFQTVFNYHSTQDPKLQKTHKGLSLFQLNEDGASWQTSPSSSVALCKDPVALASFSVDLELERCRQQENPELRSQTVTTQSQSANVSYPEVSALQSEWPPFESDSPSQYFSFNSVLMDPAEFTDSKESAVDDKEAVLSCKDSGNNFPSVMKDDRSILACVTGDERTADIAESSQSAGTLTCAPPPVTTCEVMVGTEPPQRTTAFSQTEAPGSSDKHVITEVHMADLDYLTEEFMKLKRAEEELRELRLKMKSPGCVLKKECECLQRAQQAELGLLALQYSMCRQHCWRLYCTSAEGDQLTPEPKDPPANIEHVVQKLETDFNQMRAEILRGVPLKRLKPLSVDCEKITTGGSYVPAQIVRDVLGSVPAGRSEETQEHKVQSEDKGCPDARSRNICQRKEKEMKKESKAKRAVTLLLQDKNTTPNVPNVPIIPNVPNVPNVPNAHRPEEQQTVTCRELNSSEAWYDAEEDLEPPGPAAAPETGRDATKDEPGGTESPREDVQLSVLFVSNLPSHVTKSDVMKWFEKHNASDVSISDLQNDLRVALVKMRGSQSAEAAVRELNGCNMQGQTLHVEQVIGAAGGSQNRVQDSIKQPEAAQVDKAPQTSNNESSKPERKLVSQPPLSSSTKNRKVVCISPTAKETSVPQHYCTMSGFDSLMAELTQRHSDVGRQRIVDALIELRAKHHGVLSGLPLRTIRDLTSEILSRSGPSAQ
ncbi:RNA-binding protein 44 isoform X2 [Notolabrus celidotus]|uniref:RNA-binding protein 44 isoform X2 n=1 Tax=Notolabrus celidotus TaxID=1203425 RepID=UPI00148F6777|nr:RNA-binding protein 44 isoform X2 [Notolabrus celidotus]